MWISCIVFRRVNHSSELLEQWNRLWELVTTSLVLQLQKGSRGSWKLCLENLSSLGWLKLSLSRDRCFIPLGLRKLNVLLGNGLMNDIIPFLKVSILSEFLIFRCNLFHSIIVEGKIEFLKKKCFTFIAGIYYTIL